MSEVVKEQAALARGAWHRIVVAISFGERELRGLGHSREADEVGRYLSLLSQLGAGHCDRILATNGHSKDSMSATETQPVENGHAPVDEQDPAVVEPCSEMRFEEHPELTMEQRCDIRISQVMAVIGTQCSSRRQELEVGLSFLHRARDLIRRGHPTAEARLRAAENVLAGGKAVDDGC